MPNWMRRLPRAWHLFKQALLQDDRGRITVPVNLQYKKRLPIGWMVLQEAALPEGMDYCFAIAVDGKMVDGVVQPGAKLIEVALIPDDQYFLYLRMKREEAARRLSAELDKRG